MTELDFDAALAAKFATPEEGITAVAEVTEEQPEIDNVEELDILPPKRRPNLPPPCAGKSHAWAAIRCMEEIKPNDIERGQAFDIIKEWINDHE